MSKKIMPRPTKRCSSFCFLKRFHNVDCRIRVACVICFTLLTSVAPPPAYCPSSHQPTIHALTCQLCTSLCPQFTPQLIHNVSQQFKENVIIFSYGIRFSPHFLPTKRHPIFKKDHIFFKRWSSSFSLGNCTL